MHLDLYPPIYAEVRIDRQGETPVSPSPPPPSTWRGLRLMGPEHVVLHRERAGQPKLPLVVLMRLEARAPFPPPHAVIAVTDLATGVRREAVLKPFANTDEEYAEPEPPPRPYDGPPELISETLSFNLFDYLTPPLRPGRIRVVVSRLGYESNPIEVAFHDPEPGR